MNTCSPAKLNHKTLVSIFLSLFCICGSNAQLAFEPKVAIPTGNEPTWITSGDLDGDGDVDIVTANLVSTTISVLKNNGNATFAPHVTYTVGSRPVAVDLGDVDGDSDLDIVSANQNTSDISVLRNNGNGTFATQTLYALGSSPASVVLADVDNDNDLDLLVGRVDSLTVFSNSGNVSFVSPVSYHVVGTIQGIAVGDLDGDGDRDLGVARYRDSISVLKNTGGGAFGSSVGYTISSGGFSKHVALADFDADGDLDIVSANSSPITTSVLFNNGDATFGAATTFMTQDQFSSGTTVTTGDINSDGSPDIVITNGLVSVIIGNGDGTFKTPINVTMVSSIQMQLFLYATTVADLDGDNDLDLAACGYSGGSLVAIALNKPERALFDSPVNYSSGVAPTSIASADFDNDNDQDIVVVNRGFVGVNHGSISGTLSVFMNNGDGTFAPATNYSAGASPYTVDVADFDNDSDIDFVATQSEVSYFPLKVFWNNGTGAFPSGTVIDGVTLFADMFFVSHGDVDADGDQDIVTANGGTPNWLVRNNGNHTFTASTIGSGWPNYDSRLRDIDNDGDSDYVGNAGNSIAIRKNNGSGIFSSVVYTDLGYEQLSFAIADFDGDTDVDLAAPTHSSGVGLRILNDGAGNFLSPVYFAHGGGYETKVIHGDFDSDGDDDLVYASYRTVNVTFMRNDGLGNFDVPIAHAAGLGPRALTAADFDGDGDLDVAVANETSNDFSVLFNRTLVSQYKITAAAGPNGSISPSGSVLVNIGANQSFVFAPNDCFHVDSVLVDGVPVDSTTSYTFQHVSTHHTITSKFVVNSACSVKREIPVTARWNLISIPLVVNDYSKDSLFPTAISEAYAYEGNYQPRDTLKNGIGYWLKFPSAETISMNGFFLASDTLDVVEGWNLIGSISSVVATVNISSDPPSIVTSNFFDYDGGYSVADTLNPGRAFWVKVHQSGKLLLASGGFTAPSRIKIIPTSEIPPPPPETAMADLRNSPREYSLKQNYPNPFNPKTLVAYALPEGVHVSLKVFDVLGREIAVLVNGSETAGHKSVEFDASKLPSGVYFYKLNAGKFSEVKKMLLAK